MLPRRQIREAWFALYSTMTIPKTKSKGRLGAYHPEDLPAINITTFEDADEEEERTHGGCHIINYVQPIVIELVCPVKDNFEDDIDDLEEEFWQIISPISMPGVTFNYIGSTLAPLKEVEHPTATRLLNFNAEFRMDQANPSLIIV